MKIHELAYRLSDGLIAGYDGTSWWKTSFSSPITRVKKWPVLGISHATKDLCSKSFCKCPEAAKIVFCECENELKKLDIIEGSLPKQTESLSISQCGEVVLNTNAFKLQTQTGSFRYFPKVSRVLIQEVGIRKVPEEGLEILTDHFILNDNNIGVLERSSLYSDASNLTIIHNRIERIESGAFDASVRYFNFIENTIYKEVPFGVGPAFLQGPDRYDGVSNI
ncbi:unnamed protein product [Lepeophtheirus salmonis]|uniref:(salmon louse) hypothetical protein n=1 Tax=Lepeophtheirus salmonis TaxID=72036 RepID=A0A7R8CNG3_LEPSM|nr:unnamed protein product [Lepeophtheirus salmonis]CAF2875041.1 unnamed protein product [Lepeophtheirus salmonis]